VCGGQLKRTEGRDRARAVFKSNYPQASPEMIEQVLQQYIRTGATSIICDLCDRHVPATEPVWACGNGEKTILHPTSFDVCELCFVRYAIDGAGDDELPSERQLEAAGDDDDDYEFADDDDDFVDDDDDDDFDDDDDDGDDGDDGDESETESERRRNRDRINRDLAHLAQLADEEGDILPHEEDDESDLGGKTTL
jgi:hypothetical protein